MTVIFLAALAVMTILIGKISGVTQKAEQLAIVASDQLVAKNALLGSLRTNGGPDFWGLLPLPDMGRRTSAVAHTEGESATNFGADAVRGLLPNSANALLIGRFPSKSLGTAVLRDNTGTCLWYALSAAFKTTNNNGISFVPSFNWDTLGDFETGLSANPHESRAVALIFAPGNGQARTPSGQDSIGNCGGNYIVGDYLENLTINPLNPTTDNNQAVYPLTAAQTAPAPLTPPDPAITVTLPANTASATDHALPITTGEIFQQIAPALKIPAAINTLLPLLKTCLEAQLPTSGMPYPGGGLTQIDATTPTRTRFVGPLPTSVNCNLNIPPATINANELQRWRDNLWYMSCNPPTANCVALTDSSGVNPVQNCDGLIVFSGERTANQRRATAGQKTDPAQYLESTLTAFNATAATATTAASSVSNTLSALSTDVALCLNRPLAPTKVELDNFQDISPVVSGRALVARDTVNDILTLGNSRVDAGDVAPSAGAAVGCTFSGDVFNFGQGARFYFKATTVDRGDGFVFALIDAETNVDTSPIPVSTARVCGGAGASGQYLGYASQNLDNLGNLVSLPIRFPKIGLEFDAVRNGLDNPAAGAHVELQYWGRSHDWANQGLGVSMYEDDNTHREPPRPQFGYQDPFDGAPLFPFPNLRVDGAQFHVRYEIVRSYVPASDRANYIMKVWIRDAGSQLPGMDNVTQDFSTISGTPAPDLTNNVDIYNLVSGSELFRLFRIGFTNSAERKQQITVQDLKMSLR